MNDQGTEKPVESIELEYELDESPQKVWRAISIPEFREKWLPKEALADPEATLVTPGQEVRYKMRDTAPPFLESIVIFRISLNDIGGTNLRVIHELADPRFSRMATAANSNDPAFTLAA